MKITHEYQGRYLQCGNTVRTWGRVVPVVHFDSRKELEDVYTTFWMQGYEYREAEERQRAALAALRKEDGDWWDATKARIQGALDDPGADPDIKTFGSIMVTGSLIFLALTICQQLFGLLA